MDETKCEEVIITSLGRKGNGKEFPIRATVQVFNKDGQLIAEHDPCGNHSMEDMVSFAEYCFKETQALPINLYNDWSSKYRKSKT